MMNQLFFTVHLDPNKEYIGMENTPYKIFLEEIKDLRE